MTKRIKVIKIASLCAAAAVMSETALACSVCAVGKESSRGAYYFTTGLLSFLPLLMIGGIVYTIIKKSR